VLPKFIETQQGIVADVRIRALGAAVKGRLTDSTQWGEVIYRHPGAVGCSWKVFGSRAMAGFGHWLSVPTDPPLIPQMQALPLVIQLYPLPIKNPTTWTTWRR